MAFRDVGLRLYGELLRRALRRGPLPDHVALIMDGNRRWARLKGHDNPSVGHRYGAEHLEDVLEWCSDLGIDYVTVWVASADNLAKRATTDVAFLLQGMNQGLLSEASRGDRVRKPGWPTTC